MTRTLIAPGGYPRQGRYPSQPYTPPTPPPAQGPPPLVDLATLSNWVGQDITALPQLEQDRASAVLAAASALARAEAGRTWLTPQLTLQPVPAEVAVVVVQAAARVWRNPEGWVQDTTGPYTVRYAEAIGAGLYLADAEKATLRRFRVRGGLRTVATTREEHVLDLDAYVPTPDGQPIPWW